MFNTLLKGIIAIRLTINLFDDTNGLLHSLVLAF